MEDEKPEKDKLTKTFIAAAVLILVDAFWLNQGGIAALVGVWAVLILLPCVALAPRYEGRRRHGLTKVGTYVLAVVCVFSLNHAFNSIARDRAENVIQAVKRYHVDKGSYPDSLETLVPDYLEKVPMAKPTSFGHFHYHVSEKWTSLMYTDLPPFGRWYFNFEKNTWNYVD